MDRQFECVVLASIFFCGKMLISATDLLGRVFYPAGVHFAVAEDDFCSAEAAPEEVAAYLQRKKGEFRGKLAYRMNEEHFEGTAYRRFGYVRTAKDQLVIDEDVLKEEMFGCHPCENTSSIRFPTKDLTNKILPELGIHPILVKLVGTD